MKRIRIGKDISMRWEITTGGVAIPLDGRDLTVEIKSPMGIENNIPYRVDGNILIMTYYGYEQKRTGEYSITLWEKKGKPGQNVVDVIRAFKLVETSQEEDDFVGGDLQIESVDLGTENFDILTEGGYRAINIDTLQAEALEDSVNINGKTYSNESFTITLPKANLDSAGVMGASDVRTLKEHADSIAQIKTSCEKNASDISVISDELGTLNSKVDANTADIASFNTEVSAMQSKVDENATSISQINNNIADNNKSIAQINTTLEEHNERINAKITTDRIENGAVTSEKIATSAFDSTLSVSGKIAPADVVGKKLIELEGKINYTYNKTIPVTNSFIPMSNKVVGDILSLTPSGGETYGYSIINEDSDCSVLLTTIGNTEVAKSFAVIDSNNVILQIETLSTNRKVSLLRGQILIINTKVTGDESVIVTKLVSDVLDAKIQENSTTIEKLKATDKMLGIILHIVNGRYLASNGLYVGDINYKASDLFAVISGKQYIVKGRIICCYDINKKFISTLTATDGKITIPDNVKYLAIDSKINGSISIEEEDNPVSGIARTEDIYQLQNNIDGVFLNLIQLSVKYDVYNGKYYGTDGKLYNEEAFSSTSLFCIKGDTDYSFPICYRICYYTEDKKLISYEDKKTTSKSPSNASYAAVTIKKSIFPKDSFYFYGGSINDFIVYSNTPSKDEEFDKNTIINNLQNQPSPEISVVSGDYGSIGAKYSIPINVTGKYYLGFDFKYPKDITRASSNRTLLTFKRMSSNINTVGTCIVDVNGSINSFIGQQITSNAQVAAYISSIKNNNYKSVMTTGTGHNKSIFGTDSFALRYIGSNGTPKLTINDSGITIQNDVVTIMNVPYPSDKSVLTLANTLKALCEYGGELNEVVSFIPYDVFGRSTDELVHCENVPMRTTDANGDYPVYIPYIDDSWHKLEVVFDKSGIRGKSLLSIFVDGKRLSYIDNSFELVGDGIFETSAIIGGEGFELRNFKFENNSTKIESPLIMVDMLHNVSDALSVGGQDVISVYEIERIIETYRKHGFKYAPLSLVSEYFNGNIKLDGKYFTLVHDDYFYVSRNGEIGEMLNRLYKSKNIKADYAIIPEGLTTTDAERLSHNLSVSEWSYHSESNLVKLPYDTLVSKVSSEMLNLEKKIGQVTNTLIYPYGSNTLSTRKTLKHLGFSLASTVGGEFASMANDSMALPRVNRSTGGYENLDNILSALDKYYD